MKESRDCHVHCQRECEAESMLAGRRPLSSSLVLALSLASSLSLSLTLSLALSLSRALSLSLYCSLALSLSRPHTD